MGGVLLANVLADVLLSLFSLSLSWVGAGSGLLELLGRNFKGKPHLLLRLSVPLSLSYSLTTCRPNPGMVHHWPYEVGGNFLYLATYHGFAI